MSLARDGERNLWAGTEGNGVWRFNPYAATNQWQQFTTNDGLGDDFAYAVAVDKQGRIWAGHLNHGVSVYNGNRWTNYDIPFGPIGERIFKIAVCPVDGDVWLGTSAGLTRYSVSQDEWIHYTRRTGVAPVSNLPDSKLETGATPVLRSDGLPSDQISAMAFDAAGNIYVGTPCDGIGMASRDSDYREWKQVRMADQTFPVFAGFGLPSNLINDLLAVSDGTVYAATDNGLAWTRDGGETWQFRHGKDFPANIKGRAGGPPKGWSPAMPKDVPPEEYVTCLMEDDAGVVWVGFREHGLLALADFMHTDLETTSTRQTGTVDYGRAILPMPDYRPWLASYGKGLLRMAEPRRFRHLQADKDYSVPAVATNAPFPTPARAPDLEDLNALLKEVQSVPAAAFTNGQAVALEDDWRTEGQWQGRYGRFWIVLCANWAPYSDMWGAGWDVMYNAHMGPNHRPGDVLRNWIHWLATDDNRCLEMSPTYMDSRLQKKLTTPDKDRRESEWDDHGETYPMSMDGPHINCSLNIPAGLFYLSLYEIDPNGHTTTTRFRDYTVSIRPHPGRASLDTHIGNTTVMRSFYDFAEFDQKPELAHARAQDFYNGVYKRFLVRGPTKLAFQVNRNHSFNTILPGVMLDLVDELPPPYFQTRQEWEAKQARDAGEKPPPGFVPAGNAAEAAQQLAAALAGMPARNGAWWAENKRRFYLPLLRWQLGQTNTSALATSYYELNLFADWEKQLKQRGMVTSREIEKAIRWDGVTYSCAGMGGQMISAYVTAHPEISGRH